MHAVTPPTGTEAVIFTIYRTNDTEKNYWHFIGTRGELIGDKL